MCAKRPFNVRNEVYCVQKVVLWYSSTHNVLNEIEITASVYNSPLAATTTWLIGRSPGAVLPYTSQKGETHQNIIMKNAVAMPNDTVSIARTTSMPSITRPKTTWRPSSHGVGCRPDETNETQTRKKMQSWTNKHTTVVIKNWLPLVFFPAFAIDRVPS